jgi:maleylacetoacetate isomerase
MTVLYDYWRSSAAYRLRIALGLLGQAWDAVPVNLANAEQRDPAYLARNPQGLVPSLDIDGLHLTQSLSILEYLDETRGPVFLPADAPGRARVRTLAHAIAMDIHPPCNLRVMRLATGQPGGLTPEGWMQAIMAPGLAALERMIDSPGQFCHGDRISMADICLVPQMYNARRWGIDLAPLPTLTRIDTALQAIPAFAAAHPDRWKPGPSPAANLPSP